MVLGASFDTPEENRAFAENESFGFSLLSDPAKSVGAAYEVAPPPDDEYRDFARRLAYLIDPEGVIRHSYDVKDVSGFADAVLADLAAVGSG